MVIADLLTKVYTELGEPSDLEVGTPVDLALPGATRLLAWLNEGARQIAYWKLGGRRQLRFRDLLVSEFVPSRVVVEACSADTPQLYDAVGGYADDDYVGWALEDSAGNVYLVLDSIAGGGGTTLDLMLDAAYADPETVFPYNVTMRANWILRSDFSRACREVVSLTDMRLGNELIRADDRERFTSTRKSIGTPTSWNMHGGRCLLDQQTELLTYYEAEFWSMPRAVLATDDPTTTSPDLPESFHWAIAAWMLYEGFSYMYEPERAKEAYYRFAGNLETIASEQELVHRSQDIFLVFKED